jgi:caa(3)-type oxidase subunit IV
MSHNHHSSHGHEAAHGDHDHDHEGHKKIYWAVGTALLVGTVITVLAREWEFSSVALTIAVALFVASIKAFLVCGYFMHLLSEKKVVYLTLATTVAFAIAMVGLILWSDKDPVTGTAPKTFYVP